LNSIQYLVEFDLNPAKLVQLNIGIKQEIYMSNFWACDDRIEDGTAVRDLEKKVHFLMQQLMGQGIISTRGGNAADVPNDIDADANEVASQFPTTT
jgi:hypothetical protein